MIGQERNSKVFMDERKMTIWKMSLSYKGKSNFKFCREKSIIGHGWALCESETCDYQEFEKKAKLEPNYSQNGRIKYALRCAINAFKGMNVGDWVILHDENKRFHICIVQSSIKPAQDSNYHKANIAYYREVRFLPNSLTEEEVWKNGVEPKHCIARHTIERMHTEDKKNIIEYVEKRFEYKSISSVPIL